MIKEAFTVLILLVIQINLAAQYNLELEIINIRNDTGVILVQLLDTNDQVILGQATEIKNGNCIIIFENILPAKYAIRYFHDENENDKLDTNLLGIPKEGYGMSNNPYSVFGPKKFKNWLFEVVQDTNMIIKTKY